MHNMQQMHKAVKLVFVGEVLMKFCYFSAVIKPNYPLQFSVAIPLWVGAMEKLSFA